MVTKNTPVLNLFNGDVGIIRLDENKQLKAYFTAISTKDSGEDGTQIMAINPALISDWETVFAMTIHKSQGSEFDAVMVVLPKQESNRLLTRELLYTAVTRAKKKAIIQSSMETIKSTVQKGVERVSGVQQRINTI
jgi:exodeoxyribonuclease V alpha subunit